MIWTDTLKHSIKGCWGAITYAGWELESQHSQIRNWSPAENSSSQSHRVQGRLGRPPTLTRTPDGFPKAILFS